MAVLLAPVVFAPRESLPTATFPLPVVFASKDLAPTAVFPLTTLTSNALKPIAVE